MKVNRPISTPLSAGSNNLSSLMSASVRKVLPGDSGDGLGQWVFSTQYSSDGKRVITAGSGSVQVWDVQTGSLLATTAEGDGHGGTGAAEADQAVASSRDGSKILVTTGDDRLAIWNWKSHQLTKVNLTESASGLLSPGEHPDADLVAHASDSDQFATGGLSGAWLWVEQPSVKALCRLEGISQVDALRFGPDGKTIVVLGGGAIHINDRATGRALASFPVGTTDGAAKAGFALTQDGRYAYSLSDGGELEKWELATGKRLLAIPLPKGNYRAFALSPDGRTLLVGRTAKGTGPGHVSLLDANTGRELRSWDPRLTANQQEQDVVQSLAFAPDGRGFAAAYRRIALFGSDAGP